MANQPTLVTHFSGSILLMSLANMHQTPSLAPLVVVVVQHQWPVALPPEEEHQVFPCRKWLNMPAKQIAGLSSPLTLPYQVLYIVFGLVFFSFEVV